MRILDEGKEPYLKDLEYTHVQTAHSLYDKTNISSMAMKSF